jgi:hypothetical protein
VELLELRLRRRARRAEQRVELRARHRQALAVVEVRQVEPVAAVLAQVDQVLADLLLEARLAVGREPHQLVLAAVDLEAAVVGERRVEQAERVREADLLQQAQRLPSPTPTEVVAHSPTPSIVRIAASSNGDG